MSGVRDAAAGEGLVGPTLEDDVLSPPRLRYHGLRESSWCETVKEKREDEHEPILAVDFRVDGSNLRDEALG